MSDELEPWSLFIYAMKAPMTRDRYQTRVAKFFEFIGIDGITIEVKAKNFVINAKADTTWAFNSIMKFTYFQRQRVDRREISGATVRNYVKSIKLFCEMADIPIQWKKITRGLPRGKKYADDRIPTLEEIKNFGYVLLGMLVEKISNQKFIDYVRQKVLTTINITDVFQSRTLRNQRAANEVFYDDPGLGMSTVNPQSDLLVPYAYGGEVWMTEVMDSGGGLMATAWALVQFAHTHLVWGIGARPSAGNWWLGRTGGMAGTSSLVASRGNDGVDYAFVFNTRHKFPGVKDNLNITLGHLLDITPLP